MNIKSLQFEKERLLETVNVAKGVERSRALAQLVIIDEELKEVTNNA